MKFIKEINNCTIYLDNNTYKVIHKLSNEYILTVTKLDAEKVSYLLELDNIIRNSLKNSGDLDAQKDAA